MTGSAVPLRVTSSQRDIDTRESYEPRILQPTTGHSGCRLMPSRFARAATDSETLR